MQIESAIMTMKYNFITNKIVRYIMIKSIPTMFTANAIKVHTLTIDSNNNDAITIKIYTKINGFLVSAGVLVLPEGHNM